MRPVTDNLSYAKSGVDIDATDDAKRRMAASIDSDDPRVLNRFGAFAPLVDAHFPGFDDPVMVLKTDEPGSKQKLAFETDRVESLCCDLINHLINDIVVMGAHPVYLMDCIVCSRLDKAVVNRLVTGMSEACRAQDAVLVGGETSVQPGVLADGIYVLSASAIGVAERAQIVDGTRISSGDTVLAIASNGLHTNGYTLVRALLDRDTAIADTALGEESFLDVIMRPHMCYYQGLRGLFGEQSLTGLAHITGGGLRDNVIRVLPPAVSARLDLGALRVPDVFKMIRDRGGVSDEDMIRTFNLGVGLALVCAGNAQERFCEHLGAQGYEAWPIGEIVDGSGEVELSGQIEW